MVNRRNQPVAEVEETEAEPTAAEVAKDKKKEKFSISVRMPQAMKEMVEAAAKTREITPGTLARQLLAKEVGFTGPLTIERTARQKYDSPEERKAAEKQRSKDRRALFQKLLAKYNEDPSILGESEATE